MRLSQVPVLIILLRSEITEHMSLSIHYLIKPSKASCMGQMGKLRFREVV